MRGGDSLGAVIIGRVVYGFQYGLGVRGLWVSMFDVFWFLFGVVLGGGFWPQVSIVCVCVRAWFGAFGISTGEKNILTYAKEWREGKPIWRVSFFIRYWVISTYIRSGYPFVLWGSCFWCVCVRACNPPSVVSVVQSGWCRIVEFVCVGSLWSVTRFCTM